MALTIAEENMIRKIGKGWKPAQIGMTAHYDASDPNGLIYGDDMNPGDPVSQWTDLTGNGHHFTQGTAADQPRVNLNTINGMRAVDFDGIGDPAGGDWMNITSPPDLIGKEVWAVVVVKSHATNNKLFGSSSPSNGQMCAFQPAGSTEGQMRIWQGAGNPWSPDDEKSYFAVAEGSANVVAWQPHTSTKKYVMNGVQDVTGDSYTSGTMIPQFIGKGTFDPTLDAYVGEIIITEKELTLEERQLMEGYLAWKWGVFEKLPPTHPYRHDGTPFGYGTVWSPGLLTTEAWYDANDDQTVIKSSGTVSQWDDKSGNGLNATEGTAAEQPTATGADALANGKPSLNNVSVLNTVGLSTPSFTSKRVYAVAYYQTGVEATFPQFSYLLGNNAETASTFRDKRILGNSGTADLLGTNAYDVDPEKNGQAPSSTVLPLPLSLLVFTHPVNVTQATRLGGSAHYVDRSWLGGYCEYIFTDGLEDAATKQRIEGYLAWKWGVMHKLPPTHPYRYDGREFGYGVLWTPAQIKPDLKAWYDAADSGTITDIAGDVSQIDDKSGKGNHLIQGVGANQPRTGDDKIGSNNVITFASGDSMAVGASVFEGASITKAFNIILLDQPASSTGLIGRITNGGSSYFGFNYPFFSTNITDFGSSGAGDRLSQAVTLPLQDIIAAQYNGATPDGKVWRNGNTPTTKAGVASSITTGDTSLTAAGSGGKLAEWIVTETVISDADRQKMEGYLAHKWGLQANLPAGHPYKTQPPYA